MKTTRASASPTFDHPSDIIFAAMSEVCYSRSILPCAAFEDVPIRVRSTAAGEGAPHVSHPTTIKLAARTDARDKKPSTDRTLDGETLGRCDGSNFAGSLVCPTRSLTDSLIRSLDRQLVRRTETLDRRGRGDARELRVRYAAGRPHSISCPISGAPSMVHGKKESNRLLPVIGHPHPSTDDRLATSPTVHPTT